MFDPVYENKSKKALFSKATINRLRWFCTSRICTVCVSGKNELYAIKNSVLSCFVALLLTFDSSDN